MARIAKRKSVQRVRTAPIQTVRHAARVPLAGPRARMRRRPTHSALLAHATARMDTPVRTATNAPTASTDHAAPVAQHAAGAHRVTLPALTPPPPTATERSATVSAKPGGLANVARHRLARRTRTGRSRTAFLAPRVTRAPSKVRAPPALTGRAAHVIANPVTVAPTVRFPIAAPPLSNSSPRFTRPLGKRAVPLVTPPSRTK